MRELTDDELVKQAKHSGRPLLVMAVLAALGAIASIVSCLFGESLLSAAVLPFLILVLLSAGYWILGIAANRGNPTAGLIAVAIICTQFVFIILPMFLFGAQIAGQKNTVSSLVVVFPIIALAFEGNRRILLKLQKRGLWEHVFSSAKRSGHLCAIGGAFLVAASIIVVGDAVSFLNQTETRVRDSRQVQTFVRLIKEEEQDFMRALGVLSQSHDRTDAAATMMKLVDLDQKVATLRSEVSPEKPFYSVLTVYRKALHDWKNGLAALDVSEPDANRAKQMFESGDRLRAKVLQDFDRLYVLP
jgi:hypothetical protein